MMPTDPIALLRECQRALNQVPNHGLNSEHFRTTYELATHVDRLLNRLDNLPG